MIEGFVNDLVKFLNVNPHWGAIITFSMAFIESIAVIGTIIPGSVTMTAIGILVGTGVMPIASTMMWATLGALGGDYLSYWLGLRYGPQIRNSRLFNTRSHWLDQGEKFFHKHGGKSVIIGRFFGPVRSLVPLIAGLLQMTMLRFTLAVIPAAFLWTVVYMAPGIALGAVSMELPPGIATKFAFYALLIIFIVWLVTHLFKLFLKQIWYWLDQWVITIWQTMRKRRNLNWFTQILTEPKDPNNHEQLMLVFIALFSAICFIVLMMNVFHHGILTSLNEPVFHLLDSLRTKSLDSVLMCFTFMADKKSLFVFSSLIILYLLAVKRYRAAIHFTAAIIIGVGIAYLIKDLLFNPRPITYLNVATSSSFPSGHTIFATIVFGFIAVLVGHELPSHRKYLPYKVASLLILAVMTSRLYLGAHWVTDVLASMLLGLGTVSLVTISYRRHLVAHISPIKLTIVSSIVLVIVNLCMGYFLFTTMLDNYEKPVIVAEMTQEQWWEQQSAQIPLYRLNRLGKPKAQLFIQWLGDPEKIEQHLSTLKWHSVPSDSSLRNFLIRAAERHGPYSMNLIPQQYNSHVPTILMVKTNEQTVPLVLSLWVSDVTITDSKKTLFLGNVESMESHIKEKRQQPIQDQDLIKLLGLEKFQIKEVKLTVEMNNAIPKEILRWDMLIRIQDQER